MSDIKGRRPLRSRTTRWASACARILMRTRITPNGVSVAGIGFAAAGAACFAAADGSPALWIVGACLIQLRLLANMMDGLLAVEGGRRSPTGVLFNEFPDRIEDVLLIAAAGWGVGTPMLGLFAALAAVSTAYVRALGGSVGLPQDFGGPMAKQHRMALLTAAAVVSALVPGVMPWALAAMTGGCVLTAVLRLSRMMRALRESCL